MSVAALRRFARVAATGAALGFVASVLFVAPTHASPPCGIWTKTASGTPPAGSGSDAIYDPIRKRVVMFNGGGSLWQHSTATGWSTLAATGTPPPSGGQAIYDPNGDRMVALLPDASVWGLSLGGTPAWSSLATTGTSTPGSNGPCVYDSARDRLLMVRGGSTWALDLSVTPLVWSIVATNPAELNYEESLVYDSNRDRLVGFSNSYPSEGTLWELPLAGTPVWSGLALVQPPTESRDGDKAVYDPIRDRMIMVGGENSPYHNEAKGTTWAILFRDRHYFVDLTGSVRSHVGHMDEVLVFDPVDDEILMFGGWSGSYFGVQLDDTWRLPFGNRAESFVYPSPSGSVTRDTNHPCDSLTTVTFTAVSTPYYTFSHWSGDVSGTTNPLPVVMNSYKVVVANFDPVPPPPLGDAAINLAWDDCGNNGLELKTFACDVNTGPSFDLIGSFRPPPGITQYVGISVELTVASSTPLLPDWWKHASGYCRGTSGIVSEFSFAGYSSCAKLEGAAGGLLGMMGYRGPQLLTILVQAAIPPPAIVLDAGIEYYGFKLRFLPSKTLGATSCSGCSVPVTVTMDSLQVFQEMSAGFNPWIRTALTRKQVRWQGTPLSVEPRPSLVLALVGTRWDPGGRGGTVAFTIPRSGEATLELLDVAGRKWASRAITDRSPGRHEVRLEAPVALPSGVYFIRLVQHEESTSSKLVFAR